MLYRGVNKIDDARNGGEIVAKGTDSEAAILMDGRCLFDGSFKMGPCQTNTARAHQIEGGLYGGAGISTTRAEREAVRFATSGFTEEGFVYVLNEEHLESAGVAVHEFDDPLYPHEQEVTLIVSGGGPLPAALVIEKYEVSFEGVRI